MLGQSVQGLEPRGREEGTSPAGPRFVSHSENLRFCSSALGCHPGAPATRPHPGTAPQLSPGALTMLWVPPVVWPRPGPPRSLHVISPELEVVTTKMLGGESDPTSSSFTELSFRAPSDILWAHPAGVGQRALWTLAQGSAKVITPYLSQTDLPADGDPSGGREKGLCPLWSPNFLSVGHPFWGAGQWTEASASTGFPGWPVP